MPKSQNSVGRTPIRRPLAELARDVVHNWESGDLAGAVNRLRVAAEGLDYRHPAAIRQALRFALDHPEEFARWLGSTKAGEEPDLQAVSAEAVSKLIYDLLNDELA